MSKSRVLTPWFYKVKFTEEGEGEHEWVSEKYDYTFCSEIGKYVDIPEAAKAIRGVLLKKQLKSRNAFKLQARSQRDFCGDPACYCSKVAVLAWFDLEIPLSTRFPKNLDEYKYIAVEYK